MSRRQTKTSIKNDDYWIKIGIKWIGERERDYFKYYLPNRERERVIQSLSNYHRHGSLSTQVNLYSSLVIIFLMSQAQVSNIFFFPSLSLKSDSERKEYCFIIQSILNTIFNITTTVFWFKSFYDLNRDEIKCFRREKNAKFHLNSTFNINSVHWNKWIIIIIN